MSTPRETRTAYGHPRWATDLEAAEREALANSKKRMRERQQYDEPLIPPGVRDWLVSVGLALLLGMVLGGIAVGNWYGPITEFLKGLP